MIDLNGIPPELLHPIPAARIGSEKVDHDFKGVHHRPTAALGGVHAENLGFFLIQHPLDFNAQRPEVRFGIARRQDQKIGDARLLAHIQHAQVLGFLVRQGCDDELEQPGGGLGLAGGADGFGGFPGCFRFIWDEL